MNAKEYTVLYEKYLSGLCSAEEEQLLYQHKDDFKLLAENDLSEDPDASSRKDKIYQKITDSLALQETNTFNYRFLFKAAAILFLMGSLIYLSFNHWSATTPTPLQNQTAQQKLPISAGKNTATLTLADGTVLNLDKYKNGIIQTKGTTTIRKLEDGTLVYSSKNNTTPQEIAYNTIAVPRGGKYNISLPDGTQVWLNSGSSMNYPVVFNGKTRMVTLQGEAYFEVAKNKAMPFIVNALSSKITVLGTHFNIKAYATSASVNTTLLEGSVRLSNSSQSVALVPGQQGHIDEHNARIRVSKANLTRAVAWKNGYFMFQDDTIEQIMEQISRWYNVDVVYQGDIQKKTFGGIYAMNKDLDQLLKGLELTGLVHFKIEGRRVIVMK